MSQDPRRSLVPALVLLFAASCGGGPDGPTPVGPPTITCPAAIALGGVSGGGQAVSFPAPTTSSGTQPVTVSCTPASGSFFPIGTTVVTCTAQDAIARQAACTFGVTLSAPVLGIAKVVAFGDSVTEGQNGRPGFGGMRFVDVPNAYPTKLQAIFDLEYPGQGVKVVNAGKGLETIEDALRRLPGTLSAEHPDVLLLLHGYNDLVACPPGGPGTGACADAIAEVAAKLRECIKVAMEPKYGVRHVFVSTLTPPGVVSAGSNDRRRAREAIEQVNARLAQIVPAERAVLVDSYSAFLGHEAEYVDTDGLHLSPAGNEVVARAFFAAIKLAVPATFRGR